MCLTLCYYVINSTKLSDHLPNLTQHVIFAWTFISPLKLFDSRGL